MDEKKIDDYVDSIIRWEVYKILKYNLEATQSFPYTIPDHYKHWRSGIIQRLTSKGFQVDISDINNMTITLKWYKYQF
jgi:hypothetical protein